MADGVWGYRTFRQVILADAGRYTDSTLEKFIKEEKERKIYHYLNAFGLTPWMCLHLFYIMISNFAHRFSLCTLKIQYLAVIRVSMFSFMQPVAEFSALREVHS